MPEIWSRPGYAEAVDHVFAGGPSFHDDGEMLDLNGREQSHPAWAYLARSYSPVRDNQGAVLGILVVVVEIAPVLVLVGGGEHGDQGAARWRGVELWDQTVARPPLIWSGFRAGARAPDVAATETDQQFIAEGLGQRVLPINRPDISRSAGSPGTQRNLPDVQLVTLAGRSQNDTAGAATSGEFYDVIDLPEGRIALTIGDVIGAGIASAAVMAQVTVGLREAALTSSDPSVIFAALDELVGRLDRNWPAAQGLDRDAAKDNTPGFGGELLVTALIGIFDPSTGELLLASAGHNPPAVVHRGMSTESPTESQPDSQPSADYAGVEPGPPLGITGVRPVKTVLLGEDDALVAFTRGLLKRHEQSLVQRQAALLQALSMMSATAPRSISQYLVDTLIGDQGLEHDCAMLVVVRGKGVHQMTSVLIPPHTIAVRGARRWARAQLESWGLNEEVVIDTVMSISELVSNVVQHAGTSARVTMELAERLLVMVEDTGTWSSPRFGPEDHSAVNGRGLALVEAVSDAMGYARGAVGSTVWFEIEPDREGAKPTDDPGAR
jgi:anti-sigma regulatory factor (Ser/Thr protein kinase)